MDSYIMHFTGRQQKCSERGPGWASSENLCLPCQEGPSHADVSIIVKATEVINNCQSVADPCLLLIGIIYNVDLIYPPKMKFTFEMFQKSFFELDVLKLSPKVQSLWNTNAICTKKIPNNFVCEREFRASTEQDFKIMTLCLNIPSTVQQEQTWVLCNVLLWFYKDTKLEMT